MEEIITILYGISSKLLDLRQTAQGKEKTKIVRISMLIDKILTILEKS